MSLAKSNLKLLSLCKERSNLLVLRAAYFDSHGDLGFCEDEVAVFGSLDNCLSYITAWIIFMGTRASEATIHAVLKIILLTVH